jgi:hypothetical protein
MRVDDLNFEVRDRSLNRIGLILPQDLVGATMVVRFNNTGTWALKLPYNHPMGELLRLPGNGLIVTGPNGETLISGPTLTAKLDQTMEDTEGIWQIEGASDDIILSERLAYPTPSTADVTAQTTPQDVRTGPAETVIKAYLDANLGPSAPAARQLAGLVIEADSGRGSTVTGIARFNTLQELFYDLAQVGGIGYRLAQPNGGIDFMAYEPLDRSATIRMDIQNRQLSSSSYSYGTAKVTRAIVAGRGEQENRLFIERTSTESLNAEIDWARRIEVFHDARQAESTDELNTAGDELLVDKGKTIVEMAVTPTDDTKMVYGVDWFLGDTVTIVANNIEATAVVTEVGIQVSDDGVRIGATVGTPMGVEFEAKLLATMQNQEARISNLERTATGYGVNTSYQPAGGTDGTQPVFDPADITGTFNRIGNLIYFSIEVDFTGVTSFGTGQYYLTLPYVSRSELKFADGCLHDASTGREYQIRAGVLAGENVIKLSTTDRQGNRIYDTPFTYNDPITLTTADRFHIAGTYEIEG